MTEKLQTTIIPAGWYVATLMEGKPGANGWSDGLSLTPIIAWDVQREDRRHGEHDELRRLRYDAVPITLNTGNVDYSGNPWVMGLVYGCSKCDQTQKRPQSGSVG
jgi:hypothetical protein